MIAIEVTLKNSGGGGLLYWRGSSIRDYTVYNFFSQQYYPVGAVEYSLTTTLVSGATLFIKGRSKYLQLPGVVELMRAKNSVQALGIYIVYLGLQYSI